MDKIKGVTRLTVVDWREDSDLGRAFEALDVNLYLDYQDDGKTLKVFVIDGDKSMDDFKY